jgi:hypothetical protein
VPLFEKDSSYVVPSRPNVSLYLLEKTQLSELATLIKPISPSILKNIYNVKHFIAKSIAKGVAVPANSCVTKKTKMS